MATVVTKKLNTKGAIGTAVGTAVSAATKAAVSAATSKKTSSSSSKASGAASAASAKGGVYDTPSYDSAIKNYTKNGVTYQTGADMTRKPDMAGGYATSNGYTVFYDDDGYATKAVKGTVDYTPHQDINAGNGSYNTSGAWTDNEMLTAEDLKKISDIRNSTMSADEKNAAANAIRAGYGYTIDKSGMVTDLGALSKVNEQREKLGLPTSGISDKAYNSYLNAWNALQGASGNKAASPGSYNPGTGGIYTGDVNDQLNDIYNQIMNRPGFSYDLNADMLYQQYKDQYVNQGQQAMKDTMGQAAALTGGYGSSYGQAVGQQQYDAYLQQLNEVIPDLYDRAYQQYQDEGDVLMQKYSIAKDAEDTAYDRYIDQRNWEYQLGRDQIEDSRYEQEYADSRADTEYERKYQEFLDSYQMQGDSYDRLVDLIGSTGYNPTDADLEKAGMTRSQANAYIVAYQQALSASKTKGSTRNGSGSEDDETMSLTTAKKYAENGIFNGDVLDAFHENGWTDELLAKEYGYGAVKNGDAMNADHFRAFGQSVAAQLAAGRSAEAEDNINSRWDELSDEQKQQIQTLLGKYGLGAQ